MLRSRREHPIRLEATLGDQVVHENPDVGVVPPQLEAARAEHGMSGVGPGDEPLRIGGTTKRSIVYNGLVILLMIIRLYLRKFLRLRL